MTPIETELLVIGGGPAGYPAAFYGLDMGLKVTMIDEEKNPGGVCLYRGCIPSKALLHLAKLIRETREAKAWGLTFAEPVIDLEKMRSWKNSVVAKLTQGLGSLGKGRKLDFVRGRAKFLNANEVNVINSDGTETSIRFKWCIIATGSSPNKLPGVTLNSKQLWDSTAALELREIPKKLLIVGGGYIGLEIGTVYSALGSEVTVAEMTPTLLPGADRDLFLPLNKHLEKQCSKILLQTRVSRMQEVGSEIEVEFTADGKSFNETFSAVLVSIGRTPNSRDLGLENTKIDLDKRGFIKTDLQRRTLESNIFAIGDVTGEPMLAHKGTAEAKVAIDAIMGKKTVFEPRGIPAVVFTDPEVAWVGITETEAKEQNLPVKVARFPWSASGRALTMARTEGLTKIIVDTATDRILGVGICGAGAGELISEAALALEMGATILDVGLTIHPHPTLSETFMEVQHAYLGHCTHLPHTKPI